MSEDKDLLRLMLDPEWPFLEIELRRKYESEINKLIFKNLEKIRKQNKIIIFTTPYPPSTRKGWFLEK
jgi:hypothetical protein